jgi:putative RNA 2'-phosphotransferase
MNENDDFRISKTLSFALRHEPWRFELELDDNGWADIEQVLQALRDERPQWSNVTRADLERVLANATKKRHEIVGDRIRASYGHSIPGRLARTPAAPPDILYHGTPRRSLAKIEQAGLKPMSRQYVHLSPTIRVAREVGTRRDRQAVILRVDAARAHADGIPFYAGNDVVWLADAVPPIYLSTDQ